jgi:hypothetical protein
VPHQFLFDCRIELGRDRHVAVVRFYAAAWKYILAGHEHMTVVTFAEQDLRHLRGTVDQDEGRGVARARRGPGRRARRARHVLCKFGH